MTKLEDAKQKVAAMNTMLDEVAEMLSASGDITVRAEWLRALLQQFRDFGEATLMLLESSGKE